jgi:hypothetical protein
LAPSPRFEGAVCFKPMETTGHPDHPDPTSDEQTGDPESCDFTSRNLVHPIDETSRAGDEVQRLDPVSNVVKEHVMRSPPSRLRLPQSILS